MSETTFSHQRLHAYQVSLTFVAFADELVRRLPKAKGQTGDQLRRASESIVLRIAEGVGAELGSASQRCHYRAARGSAMECAAVLDLCKAREVAPPEQIAEGHALLLRLVKMLSKLARR